MKVKITEIEADANDLRSSKTLGMSLTNALRTVFAGIGTCSSSSCPDEEEENEEEE